jgi:anti-sigma factor RsiW
MSGSACRRHRNALIDFVDRRERTAGTPAALDHLARCERCEHEMAEFALTIVALRRAGREIAAFEVPGASVARIAPPSPRSSGWSWRLQVGSLLTCAAIVGLVILPSGPTSASYGDGTQSDARSTRLIPWRVAESRLARMPDVRSVSIVTLPQRYPDGLTRPWKEVPASDATPREQTAS